nr:hypothetical protein [Cyclobacteriaceae bacterium]
KESPSETIKTKSGTRKLRYSMDTLMQKRYVAKEVQKPNQGIIAFHSASYDTATHYKKIVKLHSLLGGVKLKFNQLETSGLDSSAHFKANLNSLQLDAIDISTDKISVLIANGSLNDLVLNSDHLKDPWKLLEDNHPTATIHNLKAKIETNGNLIGFDRLDYNPQISSGTIRQFEFRPLKDKQQFLADSYYQTNYMHAQIESIDFHTFDIKRMMNDSVFHLSKIQVTSPNLEIGRDKTHPFFATAIKPLPTNAFQNVNVKFKIDSVLVSDGKIAYTEKSRITEKEGTINFSKMNALVRNVKNVDLESNDSLRIRASALFMDSARVNLRMRESYADTLGGFVLTTQVSPFKTSILNAALVPMVAVDFKSGYVDTLYMRAIGREYLSLGSMKFLYHDLKVEFLDRNDTSRHSLKNQLLKFAANTFVVRTNNTDRMGKIFYERDRNRAVFQYWVKMILSGVTTSVGAKSNKKQIRKYMKDLNQKKLPAIEDDFVL